MRQKILNKHLENQESPDRMRLRPRRILVLLLAMSLGVWVTAKFLGQFEEETISTGHHPRGEIGPFPDDKFHNLHWFVQISDIHISIFWDLQRVPDFEKFCTEYIDIIKPEVVLASGDLTDAKLKNLQGSRQYVEEWRQYDRVLRQSGVLKKTVWLDTRGNHDVFNLPSITHQENYFRTHSVQGERHPQSYMYTHHTPDGNFSFISVDSCPDPGPKRPFNFFGIQTKESLEELEEYAALSRGSNATVWFGHYPTSTIVSDSPGIRSVLSTGGVYLSGHLHTLGGFVNNMYTRHRGGFLELEVGDWKDNRIYRIFAYDHDLFSFTDEQFNTWPVVLITNPKDGQFKMPLHEPLDRIKHSTHVRMLIFSASLIRTVNVSIDGKPLSPASHVEGPLYVTPWQPKDYAEGIHRIDVTVRDSAGRKRIVSQPFTLDNQNVHINLFRRYILMADHRFMIKVAFLLIMMGSIVPLLLIKKFRRKSQAVLTWLSGGAPSRFLGWWINSLYMLTCDNVIFYTIVAFHFYVAIGPWFVGELLDGYIGVCFTWGLYLNGTFLPGGLTYFYAALQYMTFNIPLMFYLGHCVDLASRLPPDHEYHFQNILHWLQHHITFLLLIVYQVYMAYSGFYLAYGTMSFLVGPVRTWSVPMALWLRRCALKPTYKVELNGNNHSNNMAARKSLRKKKIKE